MGALELAVKLNPLYSAQGSLRKAWSEIASAKSNIDKFRNSCIDDHKKLNTGTSPEAKAIAKAIIRLERNIESLQYLYQRIEASESAVISREKELSRVIGNNIMDNLRGD